MSRPNKHERSWLVEQATQVFWRRGHKGTSIRDVGQELGLHPGSIYATFGSKEQLYLEALRHYAQETANAFSGAVEAEGDFLRGLRRFLRDIFSKQKAPAFCMVARTLTNWDEEDQGIRLEAQTILGQFAQLIAVEIGKAQGRGEFFLQLPAEQLASLVMVQILGLRTYAEGRGDLEMALDLSLAALQAVLRPASPEVKPGP